MSNASNIKARVHGHNQRTHLSVRTALGNAAVGGAYRKPSKKYYGATNVYRCCPGAAINKYVNKGECVSLHV